jgi:small-conductance mechanosensitive channel
MNKWTAAAIAVAVAFVLAGIARRLIQKALDDERRSESIRSSAPAIAGFAFSLIIIIGLLTALGFVDPSSLDQLPEDVIGFIPKALSAAILLIGANIAASFATVAAGSALAGTKPSLQRRVGLAIKVSFMGAAGLLAAAQLGVNTTVLNLAAAALFFSIGASFTLLSGLGGRQVSAELAAGRAVRRMIAEGDHLEVGGQSGTVVGLHPTAIELQNGDGSVSLVPHSMLLDNPSNLRRSEGS